MDDEHVFDLINSSEEDCIKFAKEIEDGKIEYSKIRKIFEFYRKKMYYKEDEAIKLIKNISLTQYYVSIEKTDYQTECGKTLLLVARNIRGKGSLNFRILKALCLSQFSKDEKSFIEDVNDEIILIIRARFDNTLVGKDIDAAYHIKSVFDYIVKNDSRYFYISY